MSIVVGCGEEEVWVTWEPGGFVSVTSYVRELTTLCTDCRGLERRCGHAFDTRD